MSDLLQRLLSSSTASSPPGIAVEVLRLNEDEQVSIPDVAAVISRDPAIVTKLLQIANSSYMGRPGQIGCIEDAIMVLGIRSVNLMALVFSLAACGSELRSKAFDYTRFWTGSACNAVAARLIAMRQLRTKRDEAFLAGLLCDYAQLILAESAAREYEPVLRWSRISGEPIRAAEVAQLGCDHAQLGGEIFQHWELPPLVCRAIGAHHTPDRIEESDPDARSLAQILHMASVCSDLYVNACDEQADELVALGATYFKMGPDECQEVLDQIHEALDEFLNILDLESIDRKMLAEIRTKASEILVRESLDLNNRVQSISASLERLSQQNVQLERCARTDPLTGLHNRIVLEEVLEQDFERAAHAGGAVGLLIMDIDRFKQLNDSYGHVAGDTVLKEVAAIIKSQLQDGQCAIRCGGDEFIVLCGDVTREELLELADAIRLAVAEMTIPSVSIDVQPTLSVGGALLQGEAADASGTELIEAADGELYRAKTNGRNCALVTILKDRSN